MLPAALTWAHSDEKAQSKDNALVDVLAIVLVVVRGAQRAVCADPIARLVGGRGVDRAWIFRLLGSRGPKQAGFSRFKYSFFAP